MIEGFARSRTWHSDPLLAVPARWRAEARPNAGGLSTDAKSMKRTPSAESVQCVMGHSDRDSRFANSGRAPQCDKPICAQT